MNRLFAENVPSRSESVTTTCHVAHPMRFGFSYVDWLRTQIPLKSDELKAVIPDGEEGHVRKAYAVGSKINLIKSIVAQKT